MKKKLSYLLIFVMCLFATTGEIMAETIEEARDKAAQAQAERDKALGELRDKQMTLNEIVEQVNAVYNQQQQLEAEKASIQTTINDLNVQIKQTQDRINILKDRAAASLSFYQKVDDTNPLIEQLFGNKGFGSEGYEEMVATNTIVDAGMQAIDEAVRLQAELTAKQAELETKKVELDAKIEEIAAKKAELELLQNKAASDAAAAHDHYDSAAAASSAANKMQELMEQAGCKPGEVYGVDCGQLQSTGLLSRPISSGYVNYEYMDPQYSGRHTGMDLVYPTPGQSGPIYSAGPGQVIQVISASANETLYYGGNQVMIVHNVNGQQIVTSYCHMYSVNVSPGQYVDANTQIGTMGDTGNAQGIHLHFEVSVGLYGHNGGYFVDPRSYVNFPPKRVRFYNR